MTAHQTIPLNQLIHSAANVRHTGKNEDIAALAASIAAHGLRQNLNVLPDSEGRRFAVVAGARRLRALKVLVREGKLAKDTPIPCRVLDESDDASEISLVENAMRVAMHPDDQCEAFRKLIEDRQMSVEEVAARFGVTPILVRQRLRLAGVSPKLRAIYRKGGMTLDHVMALILRDDHAAQEAAWAALPDWNRSPLALKRALTGDSVPASDRLARFVGIEAYVDAGGAVLHDLFDREDEADAGYLADAALVQRLAVEKMDEAATALKAEGWKWAKPELTRDYATVYGRVYPQPEEDGDSEAEPERHFTALDKAQAGVRLTLDPEGTLVIERGLIHPDDVKQERQTAGKGKRPAASTGLSAPLVAELTAHRTAALRVELARNASVALAATVHALALPVLYQGAASSCLAVRTDSEALDRHMQDASGCAAHQAMQEEGEGWGDRLPGDPADLFAWCLAQPQEVLLDLLAYVAALTVDAVQAKYRPVDRLAHADRLADALSLDMRAWWTPSAEGFWQRLPKSALSQALIDAKVPPLGVAVDKLKKPEAARMVADALKDSGWLPEVLRTPSTPTEA